MSVNEKMTALADEVRRVSHKDGKLSIDGMTNALSGINENLFKSIIERTVTEIKADDLAGITHIGNRAFMNCDYLTKVTIPDTITGLGGSAFNGCDRLVEVNLPASVYTIEADAFYECVALEELAMPDNVSWVGAYALGACRNLKRVTWTAKGCGLVNGCLSGCTSLEYIDFSKCIKVVNLDAVSVLNGVPNTCKFYVPAELLDEWKSATNWNVFADRITVAKISGTWEFNDVIGYWKTIYSFAKFTLPLGEDSTKEYDHIIWDNSGDVKYTLRYTIGNRGHIAYSESLGWHDIYLKGGKRIDFGEEPQQVSVDLCEFMKANATKL